MTFNQIKNDFMEHGTRRYPDLLLHSSFSVVLPFFCHCLRKVLFLRRYDITRYDEGGMGGSLFFSIFHVILQALRIGQNMQTDTPITAI